MGVILAKTAGFCWGVKRAIDIALDTASEAEGKVYTHGPLIHNPQAVQFLEQKNVQVLPAEEHPQEGTVVIRAHGVSPQTRAEIKSWGLAFKDATCPIVAQVQGVTKKYARKGYTTVIIGEEGHSEIMGLLGFSQGRGIVVRSIEDVKRLPPLEKVNVVAQTTTNTLEFKKIVKALEEKYPGCLVHNTICQDTIDRQEEIVTLAQAVNALVVVGGYNSGNTQRLAEISRSFGTPTFHVETEEELDLEVLSHYDDIGVIAGASTPSWMIRRVIDAIEGAKGAASALGTGWQKVAEFFLKSNIYAAAAAACLALAVNLLQGYPLPRWFFLIPALYIFGLHTFNSWSSLEANRYNDPVRARFYERYWITMTALASAALIGGLALIALISLPAFALLLVASGLGTYYTLRIEPRRFKRLDLWRLPASRCLVTPLAWILVAVLLPLWVAPAGFLQTISLGTLVAALFVLPLIFSVTAMVDLRDIQGDRIVGKDTLPILISTWMTRKTIMVVCAATAVGLFLASLLGWTTSLGYLFIASPAYTVWVLYFSHKRKVMSLLLNQTLIEGAIMFPGLIALGWYLAG